MRKSYDSWSAAEEETLREARAKGMTGRECAVLLKRSVASVNAKWGNLKAILAGDFLLARASELAAGLGVEVAGLLAHSPTLVLPMADDDATAVFGSMPPKVRRCSVTNCVSQSM